MTEEEASQLRQEHTKLREAYAQIQQESEQKDQRIKELEGLLMSALLRIEEEAARRDLQQAKQSRMLLLDGNGPEVPAESAFFTGLGQVTQAKTLLYYTGAQTTHAAGREENARNLMLLYGCTMLASSIEQAHELCLTWCIQYQ